MLANDIVSRSQLADCTAPVSDHLADDGRCAEPVQASTSSGVFDILAGAAIGLVMSILVMG